MTLTSIAAKHEELVFESKWATTRSARLFPVPKTKVVCIKSPFWIGYYGRMSSLMGIEYQNCVFFGSWVKGRRSSLHVNQNISESYNGEADQWFTLSCAIVVFTGTTTWAVASTGTVVQVEIVISGTASETVKVRSFTQGQALHVNFFKVSFTWNKVRIVRIVVTLTKRWRTSITSVRTAAFGWIRKHNDYVFFTADFRNFS